MFRAVSTCIIGITELGKTFLKSRIAKSHQVFVKNIIWEFRRNLFPPQKKIIGPESLYIKFSIVVPVYNGFEFLPECIESLKLQDYENIEIILVDDGSTDFRVLEYLEKYKYAPGFKVIYHKNNKGISSAINTGIEAAKGDFIGFVDCDDILPLDAVSRMVSIIKNNYGKKYYFSNRYNLEMVTNKTEKISFSNKAHSNYRKELLRGMFADHFKVFDRQIFIEVGLLRSEWDDVQDYEFALRTAFFLKNGFHFTNEYLYYHRVYSGQISSKRKFSQKQKSDSLKNKYNNLKFNVLDGRKKISIIILSLNKLNHTLKCIDSIKRSTEGVYEIVLFDNGSNEKTREELNAKFKKDKKVKLFFNEVNIGCPAGRMSAIKMSVGDYIYTVDNDIVVSPGWDIKMIERIEQSETIGATVSKVVFPNSMVQFTGGFSRVENGFIHFGLYDQNLRFDNISTMIERDCDWVPGGATLYRREVFNGASISCEFINNYEDNDFCLQLKRNGWRMVSCPAAQVLHNHVYFDSSSRRDHHYMSERYKKEGIAKSAISFYRRNGLIIKDPFALGSLGLAGMSDKKIIEYFKQTKLNC